MVKKMLSSIILIFIILLFTFAFLGYFEKRHTYFPMRRIEFTPRDIGMHYENIYFKTEDGRLELNGWFIPSEKRRATILFCHGNGGNISHRLDVIKIFNEMGIDVFIFDYRGYGKSQGSASEEGLYQDARAAFKYLASRHDVEEEKIVVYGESIGAAVAIELLRNVRARALITEGAFTSTSDMTREIYPFLPVRFLLKTRYDSISKINELRVPKLFIHSRDDEIVPFSHARRLFEAAQEPKEFLEMRGGHNYAIFLEPDKFSNAVKLFLQKYRITEA